MKLFIHALKCKPEDPNGYLETYEIAMGNKDGLGESIAPVSVECVNINIHSIYQMFYLTFLGFDWHPHVTKFYGYSQNPVHKTGIINGFMF